MTKDEKEEEPAIAADVGLLGSHPHGDLSAGGGAASTYRRRQEKLHREGEVRRSDGVGEGR